MVNSRRKTLLLIAVLTVFVLVAWVAPGQTDAYTIDPEIRGGWQPGPDIYHPSRVIVRFSDAFTTNAATNSIERLGYSVCRVVDFKPTAALLNGARFGFVDLPEEVNPDTAISKLGSTPGILYAERDYIRYKDQARVDTSMIPNDTHFDKLWGMHNENCQYVDPRMKGDPVDGADISALEAWAIHRGSDEVIVAVIDTGCYIDHPDLANNIWVNEAELNGKPGVDDDGNGYIDDFWGWDFFNDDNTVFDPHERDGTGRLNDEHGTHCAGTIGAVSNNSIGVAGVNWNVKIMPLKFIGPEGGYTSDAILALEYAADKGADIANCSWGGGGYSQALKDAIEASGLLAVCAAGNTGDNTDIDPHYPSCYDSENIISVAAMMQNERPCDYFLLWASSFGAETVDLFAPGGYILSTIPPDPPPAEPGEAYAFFYGTSMATPHVSGAAALLRSLYRDTPLHRTSLMDEDEATIKDMILDSVDVFPQYEALVLTGGRLNIAKAIAAGAGGTPIITSIEATPEWGRPPLEVAFSATAINPGSEIVDMWWDFGDGSEAVHEWDAVHTYEEEGLYNASFHVVNTAELEASAAVQIHVLFPPVIEVEPTEIHTRLEWGETCDEAITIRNSGESDLNYSAEILFAGMVDLSVTSDGYELGNSVPEWIRLDKTSGTTAPNESDTLTATFVAQDVPQGTWEAIIKILSNDPASPEIQIDTFMFAKSLIPPVISSLSADPWAGSAPLAVQFSAVAEDADGEVVAIEWDFGDGSDPVVGTLAPLHTYEANGEYIATLRITDEDGLTDQDSITIVVADIPQVNVDPAEFRQTLRAHRQRTEILTVTNSGEATLTFTAEVYTAEASAVDEAPDSLGAGGSGEHDMLSGSHPWLEVVPSQATLEPGESADLDVTFDLSEIESGSLRGEVVLDTNDIRNPRVLVPVHLQVIPNNPPTITFCGVNPGRSPVDTEFEFVAVARDTDGNVTDKWWTFGDGSEPVHELVATHTYSREGKFRATFTAVDNDGYRSSASVNVTVCEPASASWSPKQLVVVLASGETAETSLTLSNVGRGALAFGKEQFPSGVQSAETLLALEPIEDFHTLPVEGIHEPNTDDESHPSWKTEGIGSVIKSWSAPSPIESLHGVGVNRNTGDLVLSDLRPGSYPNTIDHLVTADGEHTGISWPADFGGVYSTDMAFDGTYLWQVNVDIGGNGIFKMDPATGEVLGSIRNRKLAEDIENALAYNSNDDTFYIGAGFANKIRKIKGESWDNPGEIIDFWLMPMNIGGLAYHPAANVLAVTCSDGPNNKICFVDPDSHATLAEYPHPGPGRYSIAGCDFAPCGNLWVASQTNGCMYLVETGLGPIDCTWLTWTPHAGTVPAGESVDITVTVDARDLRPGEYESNMKLYTDDFDNPMIVVPVLVTVAEPPKLTEAGAEPTVGEPPLKVTFHAAFTTPETPVASYGWDFGDGMSSNELDATHTYTEPGKYIACFSVVDELGARDEARFEIEVKWLPRATCEPKTIEITLPPTGTSTEIVTMGNVEGNDDLVFEVKTRTGKAPIVAMPERRGIVTDENASTAEDLHGVIDRELVEKIAASVQPGAVGDVIMSWRVPSQITTPWGVGFDGQNLWISDSKAWKDHIVTHSGEHTGTTFHLPWAYAFPGDMAYDANRDLMWQVNVGGDNGIYALDPSTGNVVMKIASGPWARTSQRGLAYDIEGDTFYIGGWNEDIIYHIMGPSWSSPGAVIEQWEFPVAISGLAWHPDGILWVASNTYPDMIYAIDMESFSVVHEFPHPKGANANGAGLAINGDGNLWVASQLNAYMYLVNTGMLPLPAMGVTVDPTSGIVARGETAELEVTINAKDIGKPGDTGKRYLEVKTNDPENDIFYVDLVIHIEAGPTIVEATATPTIGEPPLRVAFDATVEPGATDIIDMWWDLGDGSDPVHEATIEHIYTELGVYEVTFHAVDENGVEASAELTVTVKWLPILGVEPGTFDEIVAVGEEQQTVLTVSNAGAGPMDFKISLAPRLAGSPEWVEYAASEPIKGDYASEPRGYAGAGAGGPDEFGYIWIDSNHAGGPEFDWIEISDVGTNLPMGDESIVELDLPFAFPFYGEMRTKVRVCSNGYLTFGASDSEWTNAPVTYSGGPNDIIAVFWDDLDPEKAGNVYHYHDIEGNRFIVEFEAVPGWSGEGDYTFQVILHPDGTMVFQYLEMNGDVTSATVGIQDATGMDGLQAVYNAPYIQDGLAIGIRRVGSIVRVNPTSGYLVPGASQDVSLTFGSLDAEYGTYSFYLYVSADDPYRPSMAISVTLKINAHPAVEITAPEGGVELHGMCEIAWTATDPDDSIDVLAVDLYWSRDGGDWNEIAKGLANTGSYIWNTAEVGLGGDAFRVRIVVTDPAGETAEAISEPFTIFNDAPVAEFGFSPSKPTVSDIVEFIDESTDDDEIAAWHWEFGDGAESFEQNPKHQYSAKGKLTVKLTVTDNGGLTGVCEKQIEIVNVAPEVKILKPEAGAVWTGTRAIEYEATDADGDTLAITLEYGYLGDESGWQLLVDEEENTGKYLWDTTKLSKGGSYRLRVTASDPDGELGQDVSDEFTIIVLKRMVMAAPNPANDMVTFYYDIGTDGELFVYDVAGRLVHTAKLSATANSHEWNLTTDGRPVASGLYLYVVVTDTGQRSEIGRLVIESL